MTRNIPKIIPRVPSGSRWRRGGTFLSHDGSMAQMWSRGPVNVASALELAQAPDGSGERIPQFAEP